MLFFTSLDFTFTTRHIHSCVLFPLWPSHFILFGAVSNCLLLFPSSILDNFQPGGARLLVSYLFAFSYCSWVLSARILEWFAILSSSGPCFVRTPHYDPICLGWPCKAWSIASLSYASPSAMIRLPSWLSGKESACHCRRCKFNPFVRKIPWRWKYQPIPVFLPGKSHGQRSLEGCSPCVAKSWTRLCSWAHMQVILTYIKLEPWWKAVSATPFFFFFTCSCLPNSMSLFEDCVSF